MLETDLQKDVIDAVRAADGAAHKLSNRFLVGVSDLLVKLPAPYPAMLIEVKKDAYPVKSDTVVLDVTQKQINFLREFYDADMACGVLSFLYDRKKGRRLMHGAVLSVKRIRKVPIVANVMDYCELGRAMEFGPSVVELIRSLR